MVESNKKGKKGNKRQQINPKKEVKAPKDEIWYDLDQIKETEDIETLIEYSKSDNVKIKMAAIKEMCPCHVQRDVPEFWERIFELANDEDKDIRFQILHNMCDGSPPNVEEKVVECLEIFNRDSDLKIRRKAHQVIGSYQHSGKWNIM